MHCSKMVLLGIWTRAAISIAAYAFLCGVAPSSFASLSIKLDAPVTSMPLGVLVTTRRNPNNERRECNHQPHQIPTERHKSTAQKYLITNVISREK
jgi:hypothetical protein